MVTTSTCSPSGINYIFECRPCQYKIFITKFDATGTESWEREKYSYTISANETTRQRVSNSKLAKNIERLVKFKS
jgi:C4-type Zn-finger protein